MPTVQVTNFRSLVFWALAVYLVVQFLDAITLTLIVFGLAFFIAIVLDPPIRKLDKRGFSRGASVAIIALGLFTVIGVAGVITIPTLVRQGVELSRNGPVYIARVEERLIAVAGNVPGLGDDMTVAELESRASELGKKFLPQVGRFSLTILGGLFSLLMVTVIALYTLANPEPLVRGAVRALPKQHRHMALRILARTSRELQTWVRATFWLMLWIGVICGLGLWVLGVKSPLLFGLVAALGEAIPTIGPIISAVPPIIVCLADDPTKALWVALLYLVVQQLENNLLVPRIMSKAMNLHTVSILFCVVSMGALMGPLGILLATPLCATVKVAYDEMVIRPRRVAASSVGAA
jgi:predicted PurR-regulated permease PerM